MNTIQPPPPPQKTGNAQVDLYLRRIYEWAYLLWYYQTGAGIQDPAITGSTGAAASSSGIVIPGIDGEDGADGLTIIGPQGLRGFSGLTIPGMDGQDGEDAYMGVSTGLFDPYGAAAAAQAASQPADADLTTWAGVTPGTGVATALAVNVGTAGAVVVNGGALGTPSSGTLTNASGLPAAGVTGTALVAAAIGSTVQAYNSNLTGINQALDTTASPTFVTVKLSGLTDLKIPKHVADATGLADTTITVSANNEVTNASQPAFLALSNTGGANVTGDGTAYTVVFDAEVFDQNADFASNTFTAPVTGRYQLNASVFLAGVAVANTIVLQIVTSNRTYQEQINNLNGNDQIGFSVLADMDAADTATVSVTVSGGAKVVSTVGSGYSNFSGFLEA